MLIKHHKNPMLPVPNATLPYWRTELHRLDEHRTTKSLPASCDILIIGTGMTGVSTAYHILKTQKNPPPSIVLLEARQVCSGATGRNGGHAKIQPTTISRMTKIHGKEPTEEFQKFINDTILALKHTIEEENLDCESELRRSYDVFLDEAEGLEAKRSFDEMIGSGFEGFENVDKVEDRYIENITSVKGVKAATSTPALSFWPYKFVTQLLERVLEIGANLQTNTPVISVQEQNDGTSLVETSRGTIRAGKVVFATNGYSAGLAPLYTGQIVPYKGICTHIGVPNGKTVPRLANTYNMHQKPDQVEYLNPRPDGSIVVGGAQCTYSENKELWLNTVDDSTVIEAAVPYFDGYMQKHFRGWEDSGACTDRVWSGIMAKTPDEMPHVGKIPGAKNHYICAGFNGGGMPLIFLSALGIAHMINEDAPFSETGVPALFETTQKRLSGRKVDERC